MSIFSDFTITPVSMIDQNGNQLVKLNCNVEATLHAKLSVTGESIHIERDIALTSGKNDLELMLPSPESDTETVWVLTFRNESVSFRLLWKKPREWTFYVMISSHTDIGLHNSQYHQRYYSEKFLDLAASLCDMTDDRPEEDRYRYTMEGRWFWENYPADRGLNAADRMLSEYIRPGKIGLCAGIAGNHTNTFGFEEICRSAYSRSKIVRDWKVDTRTMCMIDNNGLSWAMVQPYADAGYRNIIFSPNQWNPLPSTVWKCDKSIDGYIWNTNAGGGGSRIDVRYDSQLPMLFFWRSQDDSSELLVWASIQYSRGGQEFGFSSNDKADTGTILRMEKCFASRLAEMEKRYPYDIWLLESYSDDQSPSIEQTDLFAAWNAKWKFPKLRTLGNPDIPFEQVRERFGDKIPVLKGEMTGGWYQHPLSAAELLADKLDADRRLANAETYASMAALTSDYLYPARDFSRAWEYLFWNDEHSYGTSGYQGRRVYETWMQHRDWIEKASETAANETNSALNAIVRKIKAESSALAVFNPTSRVRDERIIADGKETVVYGIPPCGYKTVDTSKEISEEIYDSDTPLTVENEHYRISFSEDGSMNSIFDKLLGRELIDSGAYGANCFIYTNDNHCSFIKPEKARFRVSKRDGVITVTAMMDEPHSGASITQTVTLDSLHHRIDIDNRLEHIRSMVNTNRYYRYIYYAFPFDVKNARRICQLNGCEAEYARDLTGHGTDTYMSAHEWALAENDDYGVALLQRDSLLVEFDHIHPDKTDCGAAGDGSAIYSYAANDWLQMHQVGGSHVDLRLRYAITSWSGSYKKAGLREMAECWVNPVTVKHIPEQDGVLPSAEYSFLTVPNEHRLVCLKRAEDGQGLIARLYGRRSDAVVSMNDAGIESCGTDELPLDGHPDGYGYSTLRIDVGEIPSRENEPDLICESKPAPIGSVWTGLITKPRAFRGENQGHLYLLWGQNMEKNLSHYELYRSEARDFEPSPDTLIAKVEPGIYRVGRYVDEGLKQHTEYFYRVRAINMAGIAGEFSDEFSGITKE